MRTGERWKGAWPRIFAAISGKPLREAHAYVIAQAEKFLPLHFEEGKNE